MHVKNKHTRFTKAGLVASGLVLGLMLSLTYSAVAEKMTKPQLPQPSLMWASTWAITALSTHRVTVVACALKICKIAIGLNALTVPNA